MTRRVFPQTKSEEHSRNTEFRLIRGFGLRRTVSLAGTLDPGLYAFDVATGREVWRGALPTSARATPMTYSANGKQYVVICAGGHGIMGAAPLGDYVVAFSL